MVHCPTGYDDQGFMEQHYYSQPRMTLQFPRITMGVQRLILANAALFMFGLIADPILFYCSDYQLLDFFGFYPPTFIRGFLWTPITYQFLHGGIMHLFMNMLWLFVFGPDVERLLGTRQFIGFYIICGVLGVLASVLPALLGAPMAHVIGASGAVMGVMVAFVVVDPQRKFFLFPLPIPITAVWLVILVVIFNLMTAGSGNSDVSVATHFGGMITGWLLMNAIPRYNSWRYSNATMTERLRDAVNNIFYKNKEE
jgi:membrane associated rhomboid family serine protease